MRRIAQVVVAAILAAACGSPEQAVPGATSGSPPPGGVLVVFDGATVAAEVVATPEERQLGLMHRTSLEPDAGMLFLLPAPSSTGFWMKDTLIPLSIAYGLLEEGAFEVLEILRMEPCPGDPCPSYPPSTPYDAALEVNQGWFERSGVTAGDVGLVVGDLPDPR